jgi:EAL domain-containing protein (putative c-di-GMP-specific phosphodiesterase class I)/FixJ family two-component response regulator
MKDQFSTSRPFSSLLIVDDSAVYREHIAGLCRELGVEQIYAAASGTEALAWIDAAPAPPDLLIVDLEMPVMDGVELIQQLNQRQFRMPLIVASGRESMLIQSVEAMASSLGLPVLAGLQKPVSREALKRAFDRLDRVGAAEARTRGPVEEGSELDVQALRDAIAQGDIHVYYQPKVDMRTGIIRGVEALARWNLEDMVRVSPDRFIPVAEREGLIHALTLCVMNQAFAQIASWNAHGWRLSLAINLSPTLLDRSSLAEEILALAGRYRIASWQVTLELTETSVVQYIGVALGVLTRLRLKGFGLSIDDYGTGFSSMQQLARIPFSELKVDRSFVHGARQSTTQQVIVRSALDLAHQLGLKTVAEGIETLDDWRLLQEYGCDIGQGYLIGAPMAAAEMSTWAERHRSALLQLRTPVRIA